MLHSDAPSELFWAFGQAIARYPRRTPRRITTWVTRVLAVMTTESVPLPSALARLCCLLAFLCMKTLDTSCGTESVGIVDLQLDSGGNAKQDEKGLQRSDEPQAPMVKPFAGE